MTGGMLEISADKNWKREISNSIYTYIVYTSIKGHFKAYYISGSEEFIKK